MRLLLENWHRYLKENERITYNDLYLKLVDYIEENDLFSDIDAHKEFVGKYGWNWDEYLQAQEDWLQADEDRLGIYIDNLTEKDMPISIEDVHELADTLNIPWDDNAEFMSWTKELTGKSHLDKMTNEELSIIYTALKERGKEK